MCKRSWTTLIGIQTTSTQVTFLPRFWDKAKRRSHTISNKYLLNEADFSPPRKTTSFHGGTTTTSTTARRPKQRRRSSATSMIVLAVLLMRREVLSLVFRGDTSMRKTSRERIWQCNLVRMRLFCCLILFLWSHHNRAKETKDWVRQHGLSPRLMVNNTYISYSYRLRSELE